MLNALIMLALAMAAPPAPERRCGWLQNPTPANWWLVDRDGEWTARRAGRLSGAGDGRDARHVDAGWVETNGHYGYGCACMTVTTDRRTRRVTRVISATPLPLGQCRRDRRLPRL